MPCVLCLRAAQACILVCRRLGALVARRQVIDPPAWCGAVLAAFVRGTWRHPILRGEAP